MAGTCARCGLARGGESRLCFSCERGVERERAPEETPVKRIEMSRETALLILRRIAASCGGDTLPNEDIIDVAQAVLALMGGV